MNALELYKAGKLSDSIASLSSHLRDSPTDLRNRTFLFELLCFAGEYDRAEKQLNVLEQEGNKDSILATLVYRTALHAEKIRQDMFDRQSYGKREPANGERIRGTINGKEFSSLSDGDPRIGARLEVFAAGDYMWIQYRDIARFTSDPPKRLRDLLWMPAKLQTGPNFKSQDLGEVILPVVSPLSWRQADDAVRLGRLTEWVEVEASQMIPFGQKLLVADDEEIPFLEIRELEIYPSDPA